MDTACTHCVAAAYTRTRSLAAVPHAQVIHPDTLDGSKLLEARVRMQQKYIDQYADLYDDFHLVCVCVCPSACVHVWEGRPSRSGLRERIPSGRPPV
jgi:hypothetical protein